MIALRASVYQDKPDCHKSANASTINIVERDYSGAAGPSQRGELYRIAIRDFGGALDRLAAGYEADPEKRHDLRQDIHLQLWKSLEVFDGRCSLKTWTLRVAHNTAVSHVNRERRTNSGLVSLEELVSLEKIDVVAQGDSGEPNIDRQRALDHLLRIILTLKPLDRQIMILYLEATDIATIADITGLSAGNVGMK